MSASTLNRCLTRIPSLSNSVAARLLMQTNEIEHYQPNASGNPGKRSTANRWQILSDRLDQSSGLCLDIGCNTGFFAHEIAKQDIYTIGLDTELKNIIVANAQYDRPNLLFKQFSLNKDSASQLPPADTIVFLSVFHHLVKYNGQQEAIETLQILASKCQKQFFFETGQPDEVGTKFYELMQFLGDVKSWVHEFFTQCGFSSIECLGQFDTFLTPAPRHLFLITR